MKVKGERVVAVPQVKVHRRVRLKAKETALIVVDMQNDFARDGGALFVKDAQVAIPSIRKVLDRARVAGATVVFSQDWHAQDDPEFEIWPVHAVAGTEGAEIVTELQPRPTEKVVRKVRYDAFYGTDLDHYLRVKGVKTVVVVGTISNICVLHTAGSAALRWYRVVVPMDAVGAITDFDQASTLRQMEFLYRATITTADGITFV